MSIDDYGDDANIFANRQKSEARHAAEEKFIELCEVTSKLTKREYAVWRLRKKRLKHSEIADLLGIKEKSSRAYHSSARKKIKNMAENVKV